MSLQPSTTSFATQPYLHFSSLKSNSDGRSAIHSLEKSHLSKNDVIRLVMDKDKPVFPVKATVRPLGSTTLAAPTSAALLKRKRELVDERGVEEEVARNVSKILSATRAAESGGGLGLKSSGSSPIIRSTLSSSLIKSLSPPSILSTNGEFTSKSLPPSKLARSRSSRLPSEGLNYTSTRNASLNLSQLLSTPSTELEMNAFEPTDILPSNLITPDLSSYESSPPSETASMDSMEWNGMGMEMKEEEEESVDLEAGKIESKWCPPESRTILSTTSNVKKHRASSKYGSTANREESTLGGLLHLPKWAKNKSESWLKLSVGEHLKAKHLGLTLSMGEEEKGGDGVMVVGASITPPTSILPSLAPLPPSLPPPRPPSLPHSLPARDELITVSTTSDKEEKNGGGEGLVLKFTCIVCYKTFSCRKNVRRHMVAIHKVAPPPGASLTCSSITTNDYKAANIMTPRGSEDSMEDGEDEMEEKEGMKKESEGKEKEKKPIPSSPTVRSSTPLLAAPPRPPTREMGGGALSVMGGAGGALSVMGGGGGGGVEVLEKDPIIAYYEKGEKKKMPVARRLAEKERMEREKEREAAHPPPPPLHFSIQPSNKKMRLDNIREEDRAVMVAQSVRFSVSRTGAMKASPYLASLLANCREITLDVLPSALQGVLLVYSDHSSLTLDNILVVAETALKLKVTHVKNLCEKFISNELPKLCLMRAIRLADLFKLGKLKEDLFESLTIDALRALASNDDYRDMRSELKAELLEKFGQFL